MISALLFTVFSLLVFPALLWGQLVRGVVRLLVPTSLRQQWNGWLARHLAAVCRYQLERGHALSDDTVHKLEGLIRPNTKLPLPPDARVQVRDVLTRVYLKDVLELADQFRPFLPPDADAAATP